MPDGSEHSYRSSYPNLFVGWLLAEKQASLIAHLEDHFNIFLFDLLAIRDTLDHLKVRRPDILLVRMEFVHLFTPLLQDLPHDRWHPTHLVALSDSNSPHSDRHDLHLKICSVIEEPVDDELIVRTLLEVFADCPAHQTQKQNIPAGNPIDNALRDGLIDDFDSRILRLLAAGATNEEIAEALHFSSQTIRNRVSDMLKVLKLRNRTELSAEWSQFLYSKALRVS